MASKLQKQSSVFLILPLAGLWLTGCVCALHPSNPPSRQSLRLLAHEPEHYLVQVDDAQPRRASFDGVVKFEVPPLQPGCTVYLFGLIRVADHSPEAVPAIQVLKDGRVVRRLSLRQLGELPLDSDGSRLLRLR